MVELLKKWDNFKYIAFEETDEVFEFLRLAEVDLEDVLARFEAIGFYHGYMNKEK